MDDNLALPPERAAELKKQFTGVFYDRYILGKRVVASGGIYSMISEANYYRAGELPFQIEMRALRYIVGDYGTTNPFHLLEIWDDGTMIYVDREYRWDSKSAEAMQTGIGQKTDAQYADALQEFMSLGPSCKVIMDPSAASFMAELRTRGVYVQAGDNDVMNGIRVVSNLLGSHHLLINKDNCPFLVKEMEGYSWDQKQSDKGKEEPVKIDDHGPDALRYFCYTELPSWRTGLEIPGERQTA